MATNNLDAIAMTRRIRDAQYEQIKGKTLLERLAFYREKAQAFHRQLGIQAPGAAPVEPDKAIVFVADDEGHQHHDP